LPGTEDKKPPKGKSVRKDIRNTVNLINVKKESPIVLIYHFGEQRCLKAKKEKNQFGQKSLQR